MKILALMLVDRQPTSFQLSQTFWRQRYRVDPSTWLREFQQQGVLFTAVAPEISLQNLTVVALKQLSRRYQLKISGRKAQLIARLQQTIPKTTLEHQFPQTFYLLTNSGKHLVQQNQFVWWVHQHYVSGIIDFAAAQQAHLPLDLNEYDTLTWLLDAAQANLRNNWPQQYFLNHLRFQKAWQNHLFGTALNALLDCIRLKLAGLAQGQPITGTNLKWPTTTYKIEPFYYVMLQELMTTYHLSTTDITSAFTQRCHAVVLPRQLFSDTEMVRLLEWTLTQQTDLIKQFYRQKQLTYPVDRAIG